LNNGDKLAQCRANSFSEPDESPPLAMVKRDPLGEFPSQDLVLNGEVLELGNQLIVVRSAERQELGQAGGIHGHSRARIGFFEPLEGGVSAKM